MQLALIGSGHTDSSTDIQLRGEVFCSSQSLLAYLYEPLSWSIQPAIFMLFILKAARCSLYGYRVLLFTEVIENVGCMH